MTSREMQASVKLESSASPAPDWISAAEALIRGARDSASLIGVLLQDHAPGSPTRVLAQEIVGSISRALLVLDAAEKPLVWKTETVGSPGSDDRRSEIIDGKRKVTPVGRVYRRSCVSRSHPYSCTRITRKTIDDDYTWRKYGQKPINNSIFPRSYYRCTHKHDRGCQATRQVQQSEEDPTLLVITYIGEHTCRPDPTGATTSGSCIINFGSNTQKPMQSTSLPLLKLESDEDFASSASPQKRSLLDDPKDFEVSIPIMPVSSLIDFDFDFDFLDFDFMGDHKCVKLDEPLNFECNEIF